MARCYFLCASRGSSLDQHSNNVSLFNLVEQVNVAPGVTPPPGALIPVEVHAYFQLEPGELNQRFQIRLALAADTGLETLSEPLEHRSATSRLRMRIMGVPFPPVSGRYTLRIDFRPTSELAEPWQRQDVAWPINIAQPEPRPRVTH